MANFPNFEAVDKIRIKAYNMYVKLYTASERMVGLWIYSAELLHWKKV